MITRRRTAEYEEVLQFLMEGIANPDLRLQIARMNAVVMGKAIEGHEPEVDARYVEIYEQMIAIVAVLQRLSRIHVRSRKYIEHDPKRSWTEIEGSNNLVPPAAAARAARR
jgi:hypothetical protein